MILGGTWSKLLNFYAHDCTLYRKIANFCDIENLQIDLDRLGEWAIENVMKINPDKAKALRFTWARLKDPLNYFVQEQRIPEASSCKYLGKMLRSFWSWVFQFNYTAQKAWEAFNFVTCVLKMGSSNKTSFVYMSLGFSILEYEASCWDPCSEGEITALHLCRRKWLNSQFIRKIRFEKPWRSVGR